MSASGARFALAAIFALSLGVGAAKADVLYSNGPIDGVHNAFNITGGAVADTFVLSAPSQLASIEFGAWVPTGHSFNTLDWEIYDEGLTAVLYSGTAGVLNDYLSNFANSDIYSTSFFLPTINLDAGTYWLALARATGDGYSIYWDINGGPSRARTRDRGDVTTCDPAYFPTGRCSNSFRVNGTVLAAVPEPATLWTLGAFLMLAGLGQVRRLARRRA